MEGQFSNLPSEILEEIVYYFIDIKDIFNVKFICRCWYQNLRDNQSLWFKLYMHRFFHPFPPYYGLATHFNDSDNWYRKFIYHHLIDRSWKNQIFDELSKSIVLCTFQDIDRRRAGTLQINKEEGILITGTTGKRVVAYDFNKGKRLCCFNGHQDAVRCIQFDNKRIVSGSRDRTIKIWDKSQIFDVEFDGEDNSKYKIVNEDIATIKFDQNCGSIMYKDNLLVAGFSNGDINLIDMETKTSIRKINEAHFRWVRHIQLTDNIIGSCGADKMIRFWDINDLTRPIKIFEGHTDCITAIQFDGDHLVSGGYDNCIKLWSIRQNQCVISKNLTSSFRSLQFDRSKVVTGSADCCRVWSLNDLELKNVINLDLKGFISSVRFIDDILAVSSSSSYIYINKFNTS